MNEKAFVGLDINRTSIQAMVRPTGEQWATRADDSGILETVVKLSLMQPEIVVMEAQGGMELPIAGSLASEGLPLALISPRSVREFARAVGRSRGERHHAGILAHFAELVRPDAPAMSDKVVQQLKGLKRRRLEIQQMLDLERSRTDTEFIAIHRDVRNHVTYLERSIISINEEINRTVRASVIWRC